MSESPLDENLLKTVENTIVRYSMFNLSEDIFVAFSGGKDSIATVLLLSELGYKVRPISIATGDPLFDVKTLRDTSRQAGFNVEVIEAKNPEIKSYMSPGVQKEIDWRLDYLENLPVESNATCAHCYFIKMNLLHGIVKLRGGSSVILGMHRNDMIDSFLKCYWIDLYYREITAPDGVPYEGQRMIDLMNSHENIDLIYLRELVERELAATDDPFVEDESLPDGIKILRPLGDVSERDIIKLLASRKYIAAGDFCRFKKNWTATTKAFRLIVHDDYEKRFSQTPEIEEQIVPLAKKGLSEKGTWRFRPRNKRERHYPGFKPFTKKL